MARPTIYFKTIACYRHVFERLSGQDLIDYTLADCHPADRATEKYCPTPAMEIERKGNDLGEKPLKKLLLAPRGRDLPTRDSSPLLAKPQVISVQPSRAV